MKNVLFTLFLLFISDLFVTTHHVFTLTGRVVDHEGEGIAGVVVNDGVNFTTTDALGRWTLNTDSMESKFVAISTPAQYYLPNDSGMARFYIPIAEAVYQDHNVFVLTRRERPARHFTYLAIGDPQVQNDNDLRRWQNETIKDLRRATDSLKHKGDVVAMTLGDLVFDRQKLFATYAATVRNLGATTFQTIGNHDMNGKYADRHLAGSEADAYAEHDYEAMFGPTDYSFNIGEIHVITMKNISYHGKGRYIEAMSDKQLEWLRRDLSYVPKGTTVFLNMHAPAWNSVSGIDNMREGDLLAKVLKDYVVHVFCGHTHFFQNVAVNPTLYQHNVGAACGAWWQGQVGQDGSPNGYLIVDVAGSQVKWHYRVTADGCDTQMRLYRPATFRQSPNDVVANVWDYDEACKVEWYEDGKKKGAMSRFVATDEEFLRERTPRLKNNAERPTGHLFRCHPSHEAKTVTVVFTNRFGERYRQQLDLG